VAKVKIEVEFDSESEAYELAQFWKRSTFSTYADCATNKDNAYVMRDAMGKVAAQLHDAGFNPR
jgi:hypothetical protein